jgi:hypothetical protein
MCLVGCVLTDMPDGRCVLCSSLLGWAHGMDRDTADVG